MATKETAEKETRAADKGNGHSKRVFIPRADIAETDDAFLVTLDVPGADENTTDVTVEKEELTISASVAEGIPEGMETAYAEYENGDYRRVFRLPDTVDRDGIHASVTNGVLKLTLRKIKQETKKIEVHTG